MPTPWSHFPEATRQAPTALGLSAHPTPSLSSQCPSLPFRVTHSDFLPSSLPPCCISWTQPQSNRPLAPTWCMNKALKTGSGQAQNEPTGLSRAFISPKVPVKACRYSRQAQHQRPRGVRPVQAGPCFPEWTPSCSRLPSGARERGILPMGRKVAEQTRESQPGFNSWAQSSKECPQPP